MTQETDNKAKLPGKELPYRITTDGWWLQNTTADIMHIKKCASYSQEKGSQEKGKKKKN